jgi:hypothetical protein
MMSRRTPTLAIVVLVMLMVSGVLMRPVESADGAGCKHDCTASGYESMGLPSFSGSTWAASDDTFTTHFQNLKSWNYGLTDRDFSSPGTYTPEGETGSSPNWGSNMCPCSSSNDYDLPGNVSQTSTGANDSLFSTYTPQIFKKRGWGLTFTAHDTGPKTYATKNEGDQTYNWTSGMINTFNKVDFPDPKKGYTDAYIQIKAQMMGFEGHDNGAWNALWFLGATNSATQEIDLQETGLTGDSPNVMFSHDMYPDDTQVVDDTSPDDLSAGYHVYGMEIDEKTNTISMYLDNTLVGIDSNAGNIGPWFVILDGDIASKYSAPPASDIDMRMNIMEVQLFQR